MDVGIARGRFELDGLKQSLKELKLFKQVLESSSLSYKTHRKEQAMLVKAFKDQSGAVRKAIQNNKYIVSSLKAVDKEIRAVTARVGSLNKLYDSSNAVKWAKGQAAAYKYLNKRAFPAVYEGEDRSKGAKIAKDYLAKKAIEAREAANKLTKLEETLIKVSAATHAFIADFKKAKSEIRQFTTTLSPFAKKLYEVASIPITPVFKKLITWSKKAKSAVAKLKYNVNKLHNKLIDLFASEHQKIYDNSWWSRFGSVAAGFAVAYRAINAVEYAVRNLTQAFTSGLHALDNYKQSIATISGMLSLLSSGGTYKSRFSTFQKSMRSTMLESIRLAPQFRLSIEEIGDAYKELSQFGVVVNKDAVKPTLTAIAAIKEIATTTQSSSRQIRQEIQAIFNGQARVTDQFSRFARRFPEIRKALFGINKLTTSNAEKWRLAFSVMDKYFLAIQESNKTISAQYTIARNKLSLISMLALETSGVFKRWVNRLTVINERIIDSKGHLGDLGVKAFRVFGYMWQILSKIVVLTTKVTTHVVEGIKHWHDLTKSADGFRLQLVKVYGTAMMFMGGLKTILAFGRFVSSNLTKKSTLFIATLVYGKSVLEEFDSVKFPKFQKFLEFMHNLLNKSWELLQKILLGASLLGEHPDLVIPAIKFKFGAKKLWDKWRIDILADIDVVKKQLVAVSNEYEAKTTERIKKMGFSGSALADEVRAQTAAFEKALADQINTLRGYKRKLEPVWKDYYGADTVDKNFKNVFNRLYGKDVKAGMKHATSIIKRGNKELEDLVGKWVKRLTGLGKGDFTINFKGLNPEDWEKVFEKMNNGMEKTGIHFDDFNKKVATFKVKTKAVFEYVGDYFSKFVGDTIRGEIHSITDLINGFLRTIRDAFAQAFQDIAADMIKTFVKNRLGGATLGSFLGGFFTPRPAYAGPTPSGVIGSGGAWGGTETIAMATGGLLTEPVFGIGASGRTYTLAENGPERVLSNSDSFAKPETNVVVNVINKSSVPVDAHIGDTRKQLKNLVTEVILEDRRRGGVISRR